MSKKSDIERQEAIEHLRGMIKPGDTVYTVLRHISRSGMTRGIDVYIMQDGRPEWITGHVGEAIDQPQPMEYWRKSLGLKIGGCGMDMGFHVVNSLSYALYGKGYQCLGNHGKCPSSYHNNYRDTIQCCGEGEYFCFWLEGKGYIVHEDRTGEDHVCRTCNGKGRIPNPDGPERFDLMHMDGYALRHQWL